MAMKLTKSDTSANAHAKSVYIGPEALSGEVEIDLETIAKTSWLVTNSANGKLELIDVSAPLKFADSLVVKMPIGFDMKQFRRGSSADGELISQLLMSAIEVGMLRVVFDQPTARYYELSIADNGYGEDE